MAFPCFAHAPTQLPIPFPGIRAWCMIFVENKDLTGLSDTATIQKARLVDAREQSITFREGHS